MGLCLQGEKEPQVQNNKNNKSKIDNGAMAKANARSKVQNVDVVKSKLKMARDNINTFIKKKQADISQLDKKIKQQIPNYQETGNKKKIAPLLKAKKDVQGMVDNAELRMKLVNQKLSQVQLQQMDVETINVLDDSNKYIAQIQNQLEKKDWRKVLDEAQNKYQLQWPEDQEDIQDDPTFQQMWKEIGGNKIPAKKTVHIDTNVQKNHNKQEKMLA